jgi:hypothetical protein
VAFLLAAAVRYAAEDMLGVLSWAALPITWVVASRMFFNRVENKRRSALLWQFPDALAMIVRSIRVGVPVIDAIRNVSLTAPNPTAGEFARMVDQIAMGTPLDEAITELAERTGLAEYRFFATALSLQTQTGGTLSETLENLADVIRKRAALKARGLAMTAEARTSSAILAVLPVLTGHDAVFAQSELHHAVVHRSYRQDVLQRGGHLPDPGNALYPRHHQIGAAMMEVGTRFALLAGAGLFLLAMAMAAWILLRDMRVQERYGWRIRQIHGEERVSTMKAERPAFRELFTRNISGIGQFIISERPCSGGDQGDSLRRCCAPRVSVEKMPPACFLAPR